MAQYLLEFDEAIDRKFIVSKNLSGQAKPGTMIHVLDCIPKGNGAYTVWYRVNETGQDFSQGFSSIKEFCSWARTDKILCPLTLNRLLHLPQAIMCTLLMFNALRTAQCLMWIYSSNLSQRPSL